MKHPMSTTLVEYTSTLLATLYVSLKVMFLGGIIRKGCIAWKLWSSIPLSLSLSHELRRIAVPKREVDGHGLMWLLASNQSITEVILYSEPDELKKLVAEPWKSGKKASFELVKTYEHIDKSKTKKRNKQRKGESLLEDYPLSCR
ncbi:hypothetical protein ONS95_012910 [Cadophora gregata]|uniref:uncharacterized protein n=1 Tax=Cadophora gregata TaxID=51156 RepID=UPI0026DC463C|nr:uncharacterized protein ONS95_012910 [Cadophora gregata]KAK0101106.1 hypothetical protein ONS96_006333 [Cadophora gregata f. sp. sojae]KAK0115862.1 hypothetical protein ONS95_012910 [Cadophora gregata]